jgi:hypothetical protein
MSSNIATTGRSSSKLDGLEKVPIRRWHERLGHLHTAAVERLPILTEGMAIAPANAPANAHEDALANAPANALAGAL